MKIRHAKPSDARQICDIWNPIIRNTMITFTTVEKTIGDMEQQINGPDPFFVATDADRLLGFATYGPFRTGPGYVQTMEISINLDDSARGKGIGRQLLQTLESAARDNTITALIAGVSSANPSAIAFHKANNYSVVGTLPKVGQKFDQRLDLVLLQKLL
ncbi:N-acetyltransferase family protein [Amylibacter sp. IMCC11727]|uniref:GNAT family N-acetyltransferase n=1 Tax=Amylibacter sp. IMCC11727 TaxID=3039851 RepID=UPI00244DB8D1|nr:N-acetyltransferase family protein [Amylibacter sp. IMCC11727]WGI20929.1 GNAT family N-acetyltransferase [Amylibacter sp. IMCC11727]